MAAALRDPGELEQLAEADAVLGVDGPWFHATSVPHGAAGTV